MFIMRIEVYKTFEIEQNLWDEIVFEFNRVFKTTKKTEDLIYFYKSTPFGFSYHAVAFEEDKVIGYNALYPYKYVEDEASEIVIGISGGTYVIPEFRNDIFIFSDLVRALWESGSKDGLIATLGVSNENSYQYAKHFLGAGLISYLPYYVLPFRIFNVLQLKKFSFLNIFSQIATYIHLTGNLLLSSLISNEEQPAKFELKLDEDFYKRRFESANYRIYRSENIKAYYRIVFEKGISSAYLFDFREKGKRTYKAIVRSASYIMKHEKPDIIIFIGYLRLPQYLLVRAPWRFEPQHLPLTYNTTSPSFNQYHEFMSKSINWNFGLMNFDVR